MIEVVCKHSIDEVLENPQDYVDSSEDIVLVRVFERGIANPTYIMIGCDEYEKYYLVIEDDETFETYVPNEEETLSDLYEKLLRETINA